MNDFQSSASLEVLAFRAEMLKRTRSFFDGRAFIEVQTPLLSADTVVDRHIDPIPVLLPGDAFDLRQGRSLWLQTSPEFAMKRLVASGAEAIYQISPAFRIGEVGEKHNPEFTMLEWYRCGDSYFDGMQLLSDFVAEILEVDPAEQIAMSAAFEQIAGFSPLMCTAAELRGRCDAHKLSVPDSIRADDWDSHFDILFTELVQPKLGEKKPVLIFDYPASQSALAKLRKATPPVAERFELFYRGTELANGYHELLDADELLQRNRTVNQQRSLDGKYELPIESRLLGAMRAGIRPCVGVAVGFDRLVMVGSEATSIREVLTFPTDTA